MPNDLSPFSAGTHKYLRAGADFIEVSRLNVTFGQLIAVIVIRFKVHSFEAGTLQDFA